MIGCGRNAAKGAESQRQIEAEGGTFLFLPIDLGDEAQVIGGLRAVLDRYGRLDCAANCAGVDRSAGVLDYTAADFDLIFGTNVRGLFLCSSQASKVTGAALVADGGFVLG